MINLRLGERVHYLLKQYNRSQKELADFLNTKISTINGWKQPNRNPSSDMIVPICKFFNITTNYFLTGQIDYREDDSLLPHGNTQSQEDNLNICDCNCKQDIMFNRATFSKRLIELRNKHNIMAKNIATSIGVSKQAYSQYEKMQSTPSTNTLMAIAQYFNVSLDYLTGRTNNLEIPNNNKPECSGDDAELVKNKSNVSTNNTLTASTYKEKELLKNFRLINGLEQNVILGKVAEIIYYNNKKFED